MVSPKEDVRYSTDRAGGERYYEERGHYYRGEARDEREVAINNGTGSKHSQDANDPDRGRLNKSKNLFV